MNFILFHLTNLFPGTLYSMEIVTEELRSVVKLLIKYIFEVLPSEVWTVQLEIKCLLFIWNNTKLQLQWISKHFLFGLYCLNNITCHWSVCISIDSMFWSCICCQNLSTGFYGYYINILTLLLIVLAIYVISSKRMNSSSSWYSSFFSNLAAIDKKFIHS